MTNQRTRSRRELLRLFLAERTDPVPFYEALAEQTLRRLPFRLVGATVLDLGCGPGHYTSALRESGAFVVPVDVDLQELELAGPPPMGAVVADVGRLPLDESCADGVFCSNVLEHTPGPERVIDEIERVLRPGGWAWLSWTNWYSPWGGHEISPLHYLGPRFGLAVHRRFRGEPKNVPGVGLFPLHISTVLRLVRARPGLRLLDALPRYYPSQRWLLRVPGLREVATWNCVVMLERCSS